MLIETHSAEVTLAKDATLDELLLQARHIVATLKCLPIVRDRWSYK
jgi:hypothetical protein